MKTYKIFMAFVMIAILAACQTNPFTGKSGLALISNSSLFPMAFQQYDEIISESKVIDNTSEAEMVRTVGQNIAHAAAQYLQVINQSNYLDGYEWEYHLIDSKEVNAWAMPGGKIAVYTGILPITQNESGLAAVLGHEVAHALLNHGQRRISQDQLTQLAGYAGSTALGNTEYQQVFNEAFGITSTLGVSLPFSRKFETEADELGLRLMAIAGYDPMAAVNLWERMHENSGGNEPPQFMSTHPSSQSRISNLSKHVDAAREEARKFGVTSFK